MLQVASVEISVRWYADVLGFTPDTFPANPPYSFAILRRHGAEIMLQCDEEMPSFVRKPTREFVWSVYLRVAGTAVLDVATAVESKTTILRGP